VNCHGDEVVDNLLENANSGTVFVQNQPLSGRDRFVVPRKAFFQVVKEGLFLERTYPALRGHPSQEEILEAGDGSDVMLYARFSTLKF
jgi:hypothetical protein